MKIFILVVFVWSGSTSKSTMSLEHIPHFKTLEECQEAGKEVVTMNRISGKSIIFRCVKGSKL